MPLKKMNGLQLRSRFFPMEKGSAYQIRVDAIDHDGCLGVPRVLPQQISLSHASLIHFLKREKKEYKYELNYVTSFSNRQSILVDAFNALVNENNLAFPVAQSFAKIMGAYFDPLLLADISAQKKPGFTIRCMSALAREYQVNLSQHMASEDLLSELFKSDHPSFSYSEDKINILYAQMHRFATMHPDKAIHFIVLDDLSTQVLKPLNKFYSQYPELIPRNTTIMLYHYSSLEEHFLWAENSPQLMGTIKGLGEIDEQYYQTVQLMSILATQEEGVQSKYHLKNYLKPDILFVKKAHLSQAL